MSERVEEIRQRVHTYTLGGLGPMAHAIMDLLEHIDSLTAQLADAERARDEALQAIREHDQVNEGCDGVRRALTAATQREGVLREALENIMNYADDPPCESSLTGECDKGYHNDHGQAIVRARATLLTPPPGREGAEG